MIDVVHATLKERGFNLLRQDSAVNAVMNVIDDDIYLAKIVVDKATGKVAMLSAHRNWSDSAYNLNDPNSLNEMLTELGRMGRHLKLCRKHCLNEEWSPQAFL